MNPNLRTYVMKYYGGFMTEVERRAHDHLAGAIKATHGRSDEQAQQEASRHRTFSRWMSDDPEVLKLKRYGFPRFVEQTASRIFDEHRQEIFLNNCPRCHELARTPTARQCRSCGFDWHAASPKTFVPPSAP